MDRMGRAGVMVLLGVLLLPVSARADYPWDEMGKAREEREKARRESVIRRATDFEESARGRPDREREGLFAGFYRFNQGARDQYLHDNNLDSRHWAAMDLEREREMAPVLAEVSPLGWTFRTSRGGGGWTLVDDVGWMERRFGALLTLSWMDYLRGVQDEGSPAADDDALARRVTFWEAFRDRNPDFPLKGEVERYLEADRESLKENRRREKEGGGWRHPGKHP